MQKNKNFLSLIPYGFVLLILLYLVVIAPWNVSDKIGYNEFLNIVENKEVLQVSISIDDNTAVIQGVYKDSINNKERQLSFKTTVLNSSNQFEAIVNGINKKNPKAIIAISNANEKNAFLSIISSVLPLALMLGFGYFMLMKTVGGAAASNNKAFEFSKSRARLIKNISTRFVDVAGCDEEKEEMQEIIDYLKNPSKYKQMGARIPSGIIMSGPPGTGKTLLAKAVAGEAGVPFYSISGSEFVEMFVGVAASRVRDMFNTAKKAAPCLIFIDEIDAIGRQRGAGMGGGHDEREQALNQLLVELDGMSGKNGIVVLAATNRPDVLDSALLRPGRFDRNIIVSLPDVKGREQILKVHARNKRLENTIDLESLAKRTPGFSGADLENVLNEAAILAVRQDKNIIGDLELDEAIDRVMMGPAKKSKKYDDHTKKLVAYHEAGHAIVGLNLEGGQIVEKVTIIPRGQAGGYNLFTPKKESILNSKSELLDRITSYLGGRCAEEVFFNEVTTGASGDIKELTRIAKDMVTVYGMSELGPIQYDSSNGSVFLGRDYNSTTNASSKLAYEIDIEVRKIIDSCHKRAIDIITNHKQDLIKIAEALLAQETLNAKEIELILKDELVLKDGKLINISEQELETNIN